MARNFSPAAKRTLAATDANDPLLLLLEINHAALSVPIRVVQGENDVTSNGNLFVALAFNLPPPDEGANGASRAELVIDNVGEELTAWLELSRGGSGATAKMMIIRSSEPDVILYETVMYLSRIRQSTLHVVSQLSFPDLEHMPAVAERYSPVTAPGMY